MSTFRTDTRNKPRSALVHPGEANTQVVRVYRSSPEDIILQIWGRNRYMQVALMPAEARAIAAHLVAEADAIQPREISLSDLDAKLAEFP